MENLVISPAVLLWSVIAMAFVAAFAIMAWEKIRAIKKHEKITWEKGNDQVFISEDKADKAEQGVEGVNNLSHHLSLSF